MEIQEQIEKKKMFKLHLSIITLIVNGLKSPMKRHRIEGYIKTQIPIMCYLWETDPKTNTGQSEGIEDDTSSKQHTRKNGCSSTYIKQNTFQGKKVTRDKDGHSVMIKGQLISKTITHKYICSQHDESTKIHSLLTDLKGKTDKSTM